ncbi:glycosyltransferase [Halofilum ochraceum]|uniref:glycosyltransferase n=1 Tax=Halofilum ochraceum TaxID=1611323 RepID=UPI000946D575|nr:glycosyltransferase [Halofilum ochraceum]
MKRIALLFVTSGHSGVDRVLANLLPELANAGCEFDLLTVAGHGPYIDILPDNVTHRPLRAAHRGTVLFPLIAYLRCERPAALITASHKLNRAALLARIISRVPMRVTIRMGMSVTGLAASMRPHQSRRLFRSMRRWYPYADAAIVPSEGVARDLLDYAGVSPERLHVIPNPIVNEHLDHAATEPLDDPWFAPDAPPVILGVGSLEPRKDFATLVRAFGLLRRTRVLRLVILGQGGERGRLEALARELGVSEDMRLPGFESNPYRWMRRAAVFVLCSRREGSGAVLVEALACGTPAVATDCPTGPGDILQHGRIGPVIPVGDEQKLTTAIEQMLDQPPPAETLRAAVESFDARASARRYLQVMGCPSGDGI